MDDDEKFGAMVDICLNANAVVVEVGTPAMIALMRALLWQLGQEAAKREVYAEEEAQHQSEADYSKIGQFFGNIGD